MGQNENTDAILQELYSRLAVNEGKAELIVQACFRFMVLSWAVRKMPHNEVKYLKEELEKCARANNLTEFVALMEAAKKQYKLVCHKFRYPDLVDFASFFPKKTKSIEVEKVIDDPEKPGQTKTVRVKEKVQTTDLREFCQIMPDAMGHTGYSIMHYLFQTRTEAIAHGNNAALGLAQSARKIFHTDGGNKRIALLNYCAFFTHIEVLKISTDPDGGDRTPVMIEFTDGGIEFWLKVRAMARILYAPFARRCVEIRRSIEDIETRGGSGRSGSGLIGISAVLLTSALLTFGGASHAKAENAWNGIELTSAFNSEINTSWFEEASWASIQRSSGKGEWLQDDTNFEIVTIMSGPIGSKEIKSQFDIQFVHVDLATHDMEGSGLDSTASTIGSAAIVTTAYRREPKWTVS
ncbi:hypothetical protein QTO30_14570 [Yoonia sp. GPGPB17]|uniref:hypothetical protein n=1 Tax=Yoonia sp. GPGPB17 TaxID=3026147 RepID=UPI0030BD0A03